LAWARSPVWLFETKKYLDRLKDAYFVEWLSLRALILIQECSIDQLEARCSEALQLFKEAEKTYEKNPVVNYNIAYLHARLHEKTQALDYAKRAILVNSDTHPPHWALLLLIRILRSNCQTTQALNLAIVAKDLLDCYDRDILIEGIFAAAESGDSVQTEHLFQLLRKNFKRDTRAFAASVKLNLMLGNIQSASECFQKWAEFDQQSPDFFFAFSQLCLASKDLGEAMTALSSACDLQPMNGQYQSALAYLYYEADAKDKALERARAAVSYDPECIHGWLALLHIDADPEEVGEARKRVSYLRKNSVDLSNIGILVSNDR
jgi:tetratricopeptide (TPR) repeat protein